MRYNAVISVKYGTDPLKADESAYSEPVTRQEAKDFCKISNSTDDTLIDSLITAARTQIEAYTGAALKPKTITALMRNQLGIIELPFGPHKSPITSWTLDGTTQTETLVVGTDSFLTLTDAYDDLLGVTYVSGYGLEEGVAVPEALKTAIKEQVSFLYFNRGDSSKNGVISKIALTLAAPYKRQWI